MSILSQEQIDAAVEWWVRILGGNPTFNAGGLYETVHPKGDGGRMLALEHWAQAERPKPAQGSVERFGEALRKRLEIATISPYLRVDYHPEGMLAEAADEAGFDSTFPWKTTMVFHDGGCQVSYGYCSPYRELCPSKQTEKAEQV